VALIWSRQEGETRYEVRSAGNTRRLYTNGVFHSQYNPTQPVTGSVWDLLLLPAFFLPPESVQRVLVLGVGGGAVIRQLNHFLQPQQIVGVELNPVHLEVAREYFGVEQENVELFEADARWWLKQYRGEPFDMIIDDIFTDADGDPQRAVAADGPWMRGLLKHLSPDGVLVCNFGSAQELKESAYFTQPAIGKRFARAFQLTTPLYENAIGAFLRQPSESALLRQRLRGVTGLNPDNKTSKLNYRISRVLCR
jgi:spermidine synthase